jgi:hypothetical protein
MRKVKFDNSLEICYNFLYKMKRDSKLMFIAEPWACLSGALLVSKPVFLAHFLATWTIGVASAKSRDSRGAD